MVQVSPSHRLEILLQLTQLTLDAGLSAALLQRPDRNNWVHLLLAPHSIFPSPMHNQRSKDTCLVPQMVPAAEHEPAYFPDFSCLSHRLCCILDRWAGGECLPAVWRCLTPALHIFWSLPELLDHTFASWFALSSAIHESFRH